MKRTSSIERTVAGLMLAIGVVYLVPFVPRGWIPHDEGMIGQTAEMVLQGRMAHVDYQEPYTGGLSWLYAAVFKVAGIDLVAIRWLLFAAASASQVLIYAILRRWLAPIASALGAWVALVWSFPNYFAGLPSWWILLCALLSLWALLRFTETNGLGYAVVAGLATGAAIAIKQTGIYLFVPLAYSLWPAQPPADSVSSLCRRTVSLLRAAFAVAASGAVLLVLRARPDTAEILYLAVPALAVCVIFLLGYDFGPAGAASRSWTPLVAACIAAAIPLALLLTPYIMGGYLDEFVTGAFVLPQKRVAFANVPLPSARVMLFGGLLLACIVRLPVERHCERQRMLEIARWTFALGVAFSSLYDVVAYQFVWQSFRSLAAWLPVFALCALSGDIIIPHDRRVILITASMLAWASLVQFPYGAPVYFCYVTPLALICGTALVSGASATSYLSLRPWVAVALVFAVFSTNRTYLSWLGRYHEPQSLDAPLDLPRAHLRVSLDDAMMFRKTMLVIQQNLNRGVLVAGPDCPEIYFLAGRFSPTGNLFDFFSEDASSQFTSQQARSVWLNADVIVLNHRPAFSPTTPAAVVTHLRTEFPQGEHIGRFEVRWK